MVMGNSNLIVQGSLEYARIGSKFSLVGPAPSQKRKVTKPFVNQGLAPRD